MHDPMLNQGARIFDAVSSTVPLFDATIEKETRFIIHRQGVFLFLRMRTKIEHIRAFGWESSGMAHGCCGAH